MKWKILFAVVFLFCVSTPRASEPPKFKRTGETIICVLDIGYAFPCFTADTETEKGLIVFLDNKGRPFFIIKERNGVPTKVIWSASWVSL